jgi:hypothetical protein
LTAAIQPNNVKVPEIKREMLAWVRSSVGKKMNARQTLYIPMDAKSVVFSTLALLAPIAALGTSAFADAGVFTGNGQSLHQISTKNVRLVAIDVTIVPGRGRFLFDGTVPGMDRTEFYCTFVLKSLSSNLEEVQIGFP